MAKSSIKRCETCGFFYSIHRRGFRGADLRTFWLQWYIYDPFEPGELLPTEHFSVLEEAKYSPITVPDLLIKGVAKPNPITPSHLPPCANSGAS